MDFAAGNMVLMHPSTCKDHWGVKAAVLLDGHIGSEGGIYPNVAQMLAVDPRQEGCINFPGSEVCALLQQGIPG